MPPFKGHKTCKTRISLLTCALIKYGNICVYKHIINNFNNFAFTYKFPNDRVCNFQPILLTQAAWKNSKCQQQWSYARRCGLQTWVWWRPHSRSSGKTSRSATRKISNACTPHETHPNCTKLADHANSKCRLSMRLCT